MDAKGIVTATVEALSEFLELPVVGERAQEVWRALNLDPSIEELLEFLVAKAQLTIEDGQLHSSSIELRGNPSIAVTFMTWPKARAESRHDARDQFLKAADLLTKTLDVAGMLQFDLFLPPEGTAEMRMAWMPAAKSVDSLADPLRSPLFPWGGGVAPAVREPPAVTTGSDVIELASSAWELHVAMGERLRLWPDADGPASPRLEEVRGSFNTLVPRFNAATRRLGLGHSMPVSRFDETWLPHNLANAQRFGSLAASLRSDSARIWGTEASNAFGRCWDLFAKAHPAQPSEEEFLPFRNAPLERHVVARDGVPVEGSDVFISYAWSDKTRGARDIYEFIRGFHPSVWLDEEQHPNDEELNASIAAAMLRAKCIVICLSREMLTRGGYVMREVLLAVSHIPERCLVARLDRMPVPATLRTLPRIAWFERDGGEQLQSAMASILQRESPNTAPKELSFQSPIISELFTHLKGSRPEPRREIHTKGRRRDITRRARLVDLAYGILSLADGGKYEAVIELAGKAKDVLRWSALAGRAAAEDASVFLAALRARCGLFRAHVQLGAGERFKYHYGAGFKLLDEIVDADPDLLRPAPRSGFLSGDCRIAVQDCLDSFDFAEDWFRGWSPEMFVDLALAPAARANTIVERMEARGDMLAERMFALRALDELKDSPDPTPSWSDVWQTMKERLDEVKSGSHPITIAFLEELKKATSGIPRSELAVVLADGAVESFFEGSCREELRFELADFRLRCVVRCHVAKAAKHEMLASVRGTVFADLLGPGSEKADLNVLYFVFAQPVTADGRFAYEMYMNCLPSPNPLAAGRLPAILTNPFVTAEMLSPEERAQVSGGKYRTVYDEFD